MNPQPLNPKPEIPHQGALQRIWLWACPTCRGPATSTLTFTQGSTYWWPCWFRWVIHAAFPPHTRNPTPGGIAAHGAVVMPDMPRKRDNRARDSARVRRPNRLLRRRGPSRLRAPPTREQECGAPPQVTSPSANKIVRGVFRLPRWGGLYWTRARIQRAGPDLEGVERRKR